MTSVEMGNILCGCLAVIPCPLLVIMQTISPTKRLANQKAASAGYYAQGKSGNLIA